MHSEILVKVDLSFYVSYDVMDVPGNLTRYNAGAAEVIYEAKYVPRLRYDSESDQEIAE